MKARKKEDKITPKAQNSGTARWLHATDLTLHDKVRVTLKENFAEAKNSKPLRYIHFMKPITETKICNTEGVLFWVFSY